MQFFDAESDFAIIERRLPHWSQAGTLCFITWRTIDSIPKAVLVEWQERRLSWLAQRGQEDPQLHWREAIRKLPPQEQSEYHRIFSKEWHGRLDQCHGACVLRRPDLARIVYESLLHFDHDRYEIFDLVVMPNHVHVMAVFPSEESMLLQCESWKHYTAVKINRDLGTKGKFWQPDVFDHLVRSGESFEGFRRYIRENPERCGLKSSEYAWYSKK